MRLKRTATVQDAIAFLRTIDVEVIGITRSWIVRGVGEREGEFELTCDSDSELIHFTRQEREAQLGLCARLGATWQTGNLLRLSWSSGRLRHQTLLSDRTWQPASRHTMEVKT